MDNACSRVMMVYPAELGGWGIAVMFFSQHVVVGADFLRVNNPPMEGEGQ